MFRLRYALLELKLRSDSGPTAASVVSSSSRLPGRRPGVTGTSARRGLRPRRKVSPVTRRTAISPDGIAFRDLNSNGVLDPYEDPRLSPAERVADLIPRLSAQEKAGLLFHTITGVGEPGAHDTPGVFGPQTPRELVTGLCVNHFNVGELPPARETVRWQNAMQELAEQTPHGIPITFSSDPRHGFTQNVGMALAAGALSQWPE